MAKIGTTIKIFLFVAAIFICSSSLAQKDSICKNHISINLASVLISGEIGLFYDYRLSDNYSFQISYGHRFYSFNIVQNGGYGLGYIYLPQQGDIIRVGLKRFFRFRNNNSKNLPYLTCRLSYWNLHTPKYVNRYGSNGLNDILRESVSVDKNVVNGAIGIGKEYNLKKHLFIDIFFSAGISVGQEKTHKYSYGHNGDWDDFQYPTNTYVKSLAIFPTIELGCKLGFGW